MPDDWCLWCGEPVPIPYPVAGDRPFCSDLCAGAHEAEQDAIATESPHRAPACPEDPDGVHFVGCGC